MKAAGISILNPCSENWNTFTPTATGGFCGSCQKNVIDFTHASDHDIIRFIQQKPAHACGRFRADQLKTYTLTHDAVKPGFTLLKAGLLSLLLFIISKPAASQSAATKSKTEVTQQSWYKAYDASGDQQRTMLVKGKVTAAEDNSPLPGVNITLKGTALGTATDFDGSFELLVNADKNNVLVISFIGLKTQEILVTPTPEKLAVKMETDVDSIVGELIIWTGEVSSQELYTEPRGLRKLWSAIKRIF